MRLIDSKGRVLVWAGAAAADHYAAVTDHGLFADLVALSGHGLYAFVGLSDDGGRGFVDPATCDDFDLVCSARAS